MDYRECKKCKNEFPKTKVYFYVTATGMFRSKCKGCTKLENLNRYHATPAIDTIRKAYQEWCKYGGELKEYI